jgi:HJR/Mrr/RecB family endonuclease
MCSADMGRDLVYASVRGNCGHGAKSRRRSIFRKQIKEAADAE